MSSESKARRAAVAIGSLEVDAFMLPDGSYRMSQTQVAEAVGLGEQNARDFLRSKALKTLLGKDYTAVKNEQIEVEVQHQIRGSSRIRSVPLEVVTAYWLWQAHRGNKKALSLCIALMTETIERRFDHVFGIERSESERN